MSQHSQASAKLFDYWREVARRGLEAVGFSTLRVSGETWMAAEVLGAPTGMVLRAALATIEIDKLVADDTGSDAWVARYALTHRLGAIDSAQALDAYRAELAQRLHIEMHAGPALALARLAAPHESALRRAHG